MKKSFVIAMVAIEIVTIVISFATMAIFYKAGQLNGRRTFLEESTILSQSDLALGEVSGKLTWVTGGDRPMIIPPHPRIAQIVILFEK